MLKNINKIEFMLVVRVNHNDKTQTFCANQMWGILFFQRNKSQNVLFEPSKQQGKFLNKVLVQLKRIFESISIKYFCILKGFFRVPSY